MSDKQIIRKDRECADCGKKITEDMLSYPEEFEFYPFCSDTCLTNYNLFNTQYMEVEYV